MDELALFAGAGGGLLASRLLGWRTICAVEAEPYRREVLLRRQRDGLLDVFPIWDDVRTFDGRPWRGLVDVISAGFPCQPFSTAGKRRGADDERNLWPETARIIREVRPPYAFLENVPGLLSGYFGRVLGDLAEMGYDAEWCVLGADDLGAPHHRKRVWILAYTQEAGREVRMRAGGDAENYSHSGCSSQDGWWSADPAEMEDATDVEDPRRPGGPTGTNVAGDSRGAGTWCPSGRSDRWGLVTRLDRVAHGMAHRMDRLAAIGDGQVPCVAAAAWRALTARINA
jgi:DNA (cytosine-5)-methyltransferase 1